MLKKMGLFALLISVGLFSTSTFAKANKCLANLDSHLTFNFELNISDCNINDSDVPTLVNYLNNHPDVQVLEASGNHIDQGAKLLADVSTLFAVGLENNQISDVAAKALANSSSIHWLNLGENHIHDAGARALARSSSLEALAVYDNPLSDAGIQALAKSPLQELALSTQSLSYETAAMLANSQLNCLVFINSHLQDNIMRTLTKSTNIYGMFFANMLLTPAAQQALADDNALSNLGIINSYKLNINTLIRNIHMNVLILENDGLNDEDAKMLATHPNLNFLDLNNNFITDEGVKSLASNTSLNYLNLSKNQIGDAGAEAFATSTTTSLKILDVSYNHIGAAGLAALSESNIFVVLTEGNMNNLMLTKKKPVKNCLGKHGYFCPKGLERKFSHE